MRRRTKLSIEPRYLLALGSLFCIVLIFISFKYGDQVKPVKTAVGTVLTPMQRGINSVGKFISDQTDKLASMSDLIKENESLKKQLATSTYENRILQQDKYELADLRKLYKLGEKYPSYPKVAARVISKDPNNWYNIFTIDKGSDDGLAVDMNVLAGNGLVGIITEVGHNYAKVRSIIDENSNVSGMFLKTSDNCVVSGDLELIDEGVIRVEMINKNAPIKDGYEIVTSHISNKYLQGILIGYISDIKTDPTNLTMSGYLTPVVDFKHLDNVLVITELKEKLY